MDNHGRDENENDIMICIIDDYATFILARYKSDGKIE
jgi:hypothetical protein